MMFSRFRTWLVGLSAVGLIGCGGGGGGGGTPIVGPGPSATASSLVLVLSDSTVQNNGTSTVTETVRSQAPKNATTSVLATGPSRNRFRSSTPSSAASPRT